MKFAVVLCISLAIAAQAQRSDEKRNRSGKKDCGPECVSGLLADLIVSLSSLDDHLGGAGKFGQILGQLGNVQNSLGSGSTLSLGLALNLGQILVKLCVALTGLNGDELLGLDGLLETILGLVAAILCAVLGILGPLGAILSTVLAGLQGILGNIPLPGNVLESLFACLV